MISLLISIPIIFNLQFDTLLNTYREVNHKDKVTYLDELSVSAYNRACFIDDHWSKFIRYYDRTGQHYGFKALRVGGENVSYRYDYIESLKKWIKSPSHNEVLLGRYRYYGLNTCGNINVLLFKR